MKIVLRYSLQYKMGHISVWSYLGRDMFVIGRSATYASGSLPDELSMFPYQGSGVGNQKSC